MVATDRLLAIQPASRMLPTDALFWYAEEATPALRPLVAGLLILDQPPDPDRLQRALSRWISRIPRLRQRVVEAPLRLGLPEWEDDEHFDLAYHTREVVLPEPGTTRQLLDFASAVFATPLDHLRPLWEAYLIRGLEGGRAAAFVKVHHSVMDGVGSMAGFDAMTQLHRADPIAVPRSQAVRSPRADSVRAARLARDAATAIADTGIALAQTALRAVTHPLDVTADVLGAVRGVRGMLSDMTEPAVHDPLADPGTGIGRRLDAMNLSLPRLQRLKNSLDCTLNDLVLTVLAGAVGRYHEERGVRVRELHCMVPMNLRQHDERHALGNRVGMCNIALPVGESNPIVRLDRIRAQTSSAKRDRRGAAYPLLMRALAFLPSAVFRLMAQNTTSRINLICTNVPGPREVRYLAGAKIEAMYPFAPVALGTPLTVALLSYGQSYDVGIDTDPAAIPDPERLHQLFEADLAALERRVLPASAFKPAPPTPLHAAKRPRRRKAS